MKTKNSNLKIMYDIVLNLVSTAVPLIILQIIVLPFLSRKLSADDYGYLLTVVSMITITANSLGNALNNVRLLNQSLYEKEGKYGDFNIIILIEILISFVCVCAGIYLLNRKINFIDFFLIVLWTIFTVIREYYSVSYRLKLDYYGVIKNNLVLSVGYFLGLFSFLFSTYGSSIYCVALFMATVHVLYRNELLQEPFLTTSLFKDTCIKTTILFIAGILANMLSYADRVFIYPLLGGGAVAVYYAASFLGKIVSTAIGPVASVILSYISRSNFLYRKQFKILIIGTTLTGLLGYVIGMVVSPYILRILYPQWYIEASKYLSLTTITAMVIMCTSVIKPFALKFCAMKWQITINVIPFILYIILTMLFYDKYGLFGFCASILVSNICKYLICCSLIYKNLKS